MFKKILIAVVVVLVLVQIPFAYRRYKLRKLGAAIRQIKGKRLPDWAKDAGIASWAQFLLKWILGHPAITCVIPATRNPDHMTDDLEAATGALPDEALRRRMTAHWATL